METLETLKLVLNALQDLVKQLPVNVLLADFNLDLVEHAEQEAQRVIASQPRPYDERTERERVIDWLINDIDPNTANGSIILSYLKRNRTKQVD